MVSFFVQKNDVDLQDLETILKEISKTEIRDKKETK
jgi:hypothetical protein